MDDRWAISFFFPHFHLLLCLFFKGCIMCVYVAARTRSVVFSCSIALITADSRTTARRLKTSNAASNRSYFIDLVGEKKKKTEESLRPLGIGLTRSDEPLIGLISRQLVCREQPMSKMSGVRRGSHTNPGQITALLL